MLDVYLFLLRQVYVGYCEQHDGADPQVDSYYLSVDRPGLLNIAWCGEAGSRRWLRPAAGY